MEGERPAIDSIGVNAHRPGVASRDGCHRVEDVIRRALVGAGHHSPIAPVPLLDEGLQCASLIIQVVRANRPHVVCRRSRYTKERVAYSADVGT